LDKLGGGGGGRGVFGKMKGMSKKTKTTKVIDSKGKQCDFFLVDCSNDISVG
jgi:hypothetical protein